MIPSDILHQNRRHRSRGGSCREICLGTPARAATFCQLERLLTIRLLPSCCTVCLRSVPAALPLAAGGGMLPETVKESSFC